MNASESLQVLVVFAHGKESGPWGSKIRHLASIAEQHGAQVLSPDFGDLMDASARVERLLHLPLSVHSARLHLLAADHRLSTVLGEVGAHFERFLQRVLAGSATPGNELE